MTIATRLYITPPSLRTVMRELAGGVAAPEVLVEIILQAVTAAAVRPNS
jgi:hypothetical protein